MDIDEDDVKSPMGSPGVEAVIGEIIHPMKMFSVTYKWDDKNGIDEHVTQDIVLPSGVDVTEEGTVEGRVEPSKRETAITVDMTSSLMYSVREYSNEFFDYTGVRYQDSHDKVKAWKAAIAKAQGSSSANKIKFIHYESTIGVSVEKDPVQTEVGKGIRAFTVGKKGNPEAMAHVELRADIPFHTVVGSNDSMPSRFFAANAAP